MGGRRNRNRAASWSRLEYLIKPAMFMGKDVWPPAQMLMQPQDFRKRKDRDMRTQISQQLPLSHDQFKVEILRAVAKPRKFIAEPS